MNEIQTQEDDTNASYISDPDEHRQYHITHLRRGDSDRYIEPLGGVTIAFKIIPFTKDSGHPGYKIIYGLGICNEEDRYHKALGRNLACDRVDIALQNGAYLFVDEGGSPITGPDQISRDHQAVFEGAGSFYIDLVPEMVTKDNELVPSRFLHFAVVKEILQDAKKEIRRLDKFSGYSLRSAFDKVVDNICYPYRVEGKLLD